MSAKRPKLRSAFTLGGEQAEADGLLEDAFFDSSDYEVVASKEDRRCFLVGRTGSGKSAALTRLEEVQPNHVIRINPEDLSLPYITNLQAIRYLDTLEINLDTFWTTLWKHVLLVEIIRHRYKVNTPAAKQHFVRNLMSKIKNDPAKKAALEYLEEYEGRFWCETDDRVREITDNFTKKLDAEAGTGIGPAKISGAYEVATSHEMRAEQVSRFQRIVNETQLARLNKMMTVLNEDILESPQDFTYVIIDDLDRDWVDERIANDLIRCLFRTVQDLKRVQNLKVLVALRTNIFQELDFGRRGGGQEEKLRSLVLQMRWTRNDLEELLDERVRVAGAKVGLEATSVSALLPQTNRTRNALTYIFDRTLMRPRDAIAYANEALAVGVGKSRLTWVDIHTAEKLYSSKRLLALRDEWKPTYPGIDQVIAKFKSGTARMDRGEFQSRLDDAMLLLSDSNFEGVLWLTRASNALWTATADSSWAQMYQPLIRILFTTGLVGLAPRPAAAPLFFVDDPEFADHDNNVERCNGFVIHRMFQAGLDIRPQE